MPLLEPSVQKVPTFTHQISSHWQHSGNQVPEILHIKDMKFVWYYTSYLYHTLFNIKNITDILPFSRHFVYILHHGKTLRRKNGQRVHIRWRSDFPQLLCKNNTILTMSWSFIRFLHWIFNDAEQERIQTSHGAAYGEDHVHAELQP